MLMIDIWRNLNGRCFAFEFILNVLDKLDTIQYNTTQYNPIHDR